MRARAKHCKIDHHYCISLSTHENLPPPWNPFPGRAAGNDGAALVDSLPQRVLQAAVLDLLLADGCPVLRVSAFQLHASRLQFLLEKIKMFLDDTVVPTY